MYLELVISNELNYEFAPINDERASISPIPLSSMMSVRTFIVLTDNFLQCKDCEKGCVQSPGKAYMQSHLSSMHMCTAC